MDNQKIIIVGSDFKWEEKKLLEACSDVEFLLLSELEIQMGEKTQFMKNGVDIFDDFLGNEKFIIRRSRGNFEKLVTFVEILNKRGFIFTDSFRSVSTNLNKEIFLATIESSIFPHPNESILLQREDNIANKVFNFPLISKPVMGRHGEGIVIHENFKSLQNELKKTEENLLIQKYLEIESEYRIFVVGNAALGAIEKKAAPGKKIANYAAGASFHLVDLPQDFLNEAIKLCQMQEIDIGGVDVAKTKTGEHYILEINRCPEFQAFSNATGLNVAEKIINFIKQKK
ncbi:ATP-grasp domain-containing protein [Candidatus Peregrinibacteria bacterium]|nr:ATP-grasp domain-containing protein [Candidatus Peregrinibacteria bacterium]